MIRAFIAVELSPELRAHIAKAQTSLKDHLMRELRRRGPDVRVQWVRPEAMHVTLKFLGNVAEDTLPDIQEAMAQVAGGYAHFSLEVGGLGVFPDLRAPRVLWIGLSGAVEALVRLAGELDGKLQGMGFAPEAKPFQPHLTLARIKERSREVGRVLGESGLLAQIGSVGSLGVTSLSLMKSDLQPSGALYTRLYDAPLGKS